MPSWNDGESSSASYLPEFADLDYAPDTLDDPNFCGIAVDCPELCRVHRLEPRKAVAFEGSNTGRKFYLCQVQNQVSNCGFQSWLDDEWPDSLKHALSRLWMQYHDSNSVRIEERIDNAKLVKELSDEKKKVEAKYSSLINDVNKFMDGTERKVLEKNYAMIKNNTVEQNGEVQVLKNEVPMLKKVQKTQAEVMKRKQQMWDEENGALKEEKKKLEYAIYDLMKANEANKDKLKRIKEIFDE